MITTKSTINILLLRLQEHEKRNEMKTILKICMQNVLQYNKVYKPFSQYFFLSIFFLNVFIEYFSMHGHSIFHQ